MSLGECVRDWGISFQLGLWQLSPIPKIATAGWGWEWQFGLGFSLGLQFKVGTVIWDCRNSLCSSLRVGLKFVFAVRDWLSSFGIVWGLVFNQNPRELFWVGWQFEIRAALWGWDVRKCTNVFFGYLKTVLTLSRRYSMKYQDCDAGEIFIDILGKTLQTDVNIRVGCCPVYYGLTQNLVNILLRCFHMVVAIAVLLKKWIDDQRWWVDIVYKLTCQTMSYCTFH